MFIKNEIYFWEWLVALFLVFLGTIVMIFIDTHIAIYMLIFAAACFVFILFHLKNAKKRIDINEEGIVCTNREKIVWKYKWSEIEELTIGVRYGNPSVEIKRTPDCTNYNPKIETFFPGFQLGWSAKKALKNHGMTIDRKKGKIYKKTGDGLREPF